MPPVQDSPDAIEATYRIRSDAASAERFAEEIALEQTVEVPFSLAKAHDGARELVGEVQRIQPADAADRFDVTIRFRSELASDNLGQLLNLVYGNISLKAAIRLIELKLPDGLAAQFGGPRFGIDGLRQRLQTGRRPLLATALKPRGVTTEQLADIATQFVAGGGDVVKDDHNLVETSFEAFASRVAAIHQAVNAAAGRRGRPAAYLPNLAVSPLELPRYVDFLAGMGISGVLVAPLLLGLDAVRWIAADGRLFLMAHPTFTGSYFHDPDHGIAPPVLLGTLFRLAGCDSSIFPNSGGRFTFDRDDCLSIAAALREPLGTCAAAWPAPAGGMRLDAVPRMADEFGSDAIHLIGGALLQSPDGIRHATEQFYRSIQERFADEEHSPQETHSKPQEETILSACEFPVSAPAGRLLEYLKFHEFQWQGREPQVYKPSSELPFSGVGRVELIGKAGEATAFDLRYFEIEPGGYSSREKHRHTHVVVCLRGRGTLTSGEQSFTLDPFDIAYVPPLRVHQLTNNGPEPFGFLCIVDRHRDRPMSP